MEKTILLEKSKLDDFLGKLTEGYQVYVPVKGGEQRFFRKYAGPAADIVIGFRLNNIRGFSPWTPTSF